MNYQMDKRLAYELRNKDLCEQLSKWAIFITHMTFLRHFCIGSSKQTSLTRWRRNFCYFFVIVKQSLIAMSWHE